MYNVGFSVAGASCLANSYEVAAIECVELPKWHGDPLEWYCPFRYGLVFDMERRTYVKFYRLGGCVDNTVCRFGYLKEGCGMGKITASTNIVTLKKKTKVQEKVKYN